MGNIPITDVRSLLFTLPLYGCGALLVRELTRRIGRGWPTMMTLALAYGLIEEAFVTQTLWNPNWSGVRILDYGFIPALGLAGPWTMFMVGVHTVFSISAPIAVMETLAGPRRTTPWLGRLGLTVTSVLYAGIVLFGAVNSLVRANFASPPQLIGAAVVIAAIVTAGLRLPVHNPATTAPLPGRAPSPWAAGAFALAAGSLFVLLYAVDPTGLSPWLAAAIPLPAWLSVLLYLALFATVAAVLLRWSGRPGWSQAHRLALAGGAMLAYAWHSFPWQPIPLPGEGQASPALDQTSNTILTAATLVLLVIAARRLRAEG
ncbi:unnamed protein product [[Actinomadura] parvosata subsp. kistnae]|nr:unnamed protein product [Actinomadura parvosata subsp. kistnae]